MDRQSYKTPSINTSKSMRNWWIVDAKDAVVGRLATKIAFYLRGKHKPTFTPHVNCGDSVIVINAEKVAFTGKKEENKTYLRHTGYPGGQKSITPRELRKKKPIAILERAVKGMLPKNRLGRELFRYLHVCEGSEHKFAAQKPQKLQ